MSKNLVVVGGLAALVAATYFGFGAANRANTAQAEGESKTKWTTSSVNLDSEKAKLGYTIGAGIGRDLIQGGLGNEIEVDALIAAIKDSASGADSRMTNEEMQQAQQTFQLKKQQEFATLSAENKTKGEAFLAKNATEEGIQTTESGLQYQIVREGKGKQPIAENTVKVHYLGSLIDGTPFDSSYQRNEPVDFPLTGVLPGFSEGIQLMKEGAKYRFVIPAGLAYGEQGPENIGPNQTLIFEVELLEVK
jgi:FKBP-type peptidyl-prolyl cis-trans isomerase